MPAMNPGQIVEQAIAVLNLMRRQESGTADLGYVAENKLWQAAIVRDVRDAGKRNPQELLAGLIKVDLVTLRVNAVVAQTEFVAQFWTEKMRPAGGEAAVSVVFYATEEAAAIAIRGIERTRKNAGLVFVAEAEEAIILFGVFLIDANVEVVTSFLANWI